MDRHQDLRKRLGNKGLTDQRRVALLTEDADVIRQIGALRPDLVAIHDMNGDAVALEFDLQG